MNNFEFLINYLKHSKREQKILYQNHFNQNEIDLINRFYENNRIFRDNGNTFWIDEDLNGYVLDRGTRKWHMVYLGKKLQTMFDNFITKPAKKVSVKTVETLIDHGLINFKKLPVTTLQELRRSKRYGALASKRLKVKNLTNRRQS